MIISFTKWYPIAMVNGSPIWYRTWNLSLQGTSHALTMQAKAAGTAFDPDPIVVYAIRKSTLAALIEDKILAQKGRSIVSDFDAKTEEYIAMALASSTDIGKAADLMYGFSASNFHDIILAPESRREVAHNALKKLHLNSDAWFAGIKKKADVQIFLNGYRWDGETVR
ncbi:MAG: hypothetical protein Q8R30_03075 [bacterium]|nr:hypothetical protein [bacterium]